MNDYRLDEQQIRERHAELKEAIKFAELEADSLDEFIEEAEERKSKYQKALKEINEEKAP